MKQRGIEERAAASFTKMEICNSKRKKYESDENFKETLSGKSMSFEDHPTSSEEELKADVCRFSQMRKNSPDELEGITDGDTKSFAGLKKPKIEFDTSESEKPKIKNRKALASQSSNYILQNVIESPNMYGGSLQRSSSSSGHGRGMEEEQVRSRAYMEDQGFHKAELAEKCKVLLSYRVLQNSALGNQFLGNKNEELAIDSCDKTKSAMAYKEHCMNKQSHAKKKVPSPTMQPPSSSTQPEECNTQIGLETCPSTFSECRDKDSTFLYISVPDADFHNFDADRTEKDMSAGQVWAAYDDKDGMPRFYCRILKVLSIAPFKVRVRWLEPHPSCAEVNKWLAANHILTCGVFKNGSATETLDQINVFSHVMLTAIGQKGLMRIYPKRGEIWATYKRWSLKWLQPTTEDCMRTYEYDMVEVISDFSEKMGVYAIRLAKAQGFRTLYKRENEMALQNFMCLPEEIFRFSHRIPAHKMTGDEAPNLPEGCWELDPASTPLDLLCSQK
ncbi:hypothetical protein O6H91_Y320900 [Diphasiastrum complanatum]|nr:hypothetical protein O6H91_Y320900 [Diphasiastrum complanatum]